MNFQDFTTSRAGIALGMAFGRLCPPKLARRGGRWIANFLAKKDTPLVRAIRLNQWVVHDKKLSSEELDEAARQVLQHTALCIYDFYHHLNKPESILERVHLSPRAHALLERQHTSSRGLMIVGVHLSNFDMALLALGLMGLRPQVLSYAEPTGGYRWQNEFRAKAGLEIAPVSADTLKLATRRLRDGGIVGTGVDRPVPYSKHQLSFFGHTTVMPRGHIRLALSADVPIVVLSIHYGADGYYHLDVSEPIEMVDYGDRQESLRKNGERVLLEIEAAIREYPEQWLMYFPVWPQFFPELP